ncbi:putative RDD family membrane protein YckC [Chryseobacterium ginsenosidimutans]|uniref:RDD family protein n=1 Tax=Chryseobacterium ginsenosidimutans TaxID=687846 RepID=UPI00278AF5B2|nr:RDD family protein [Chryseobacterium ginsenosidimutans]MDQ0592875.1 putative RDD family membrane protein YckC [Chryseobacterium ginsenosidimutans]
MKKLLRVVENNKTNLWIRFAHLVIDRIVVFVLFAAFGFFSSLTYELFGIEYFIILAEKLSAVSKFMDIIITTTVYLLYLILMEYFTKGRTVGKYITGSKVISTDGTEPSFQDYFLRNISRIVPFDTLSFFGENGWHDSWSDTRVINIKNYKTETQSKSEIESIGAKEIA